MNHNQKINYMRIAAGLAGFHINNKELDLLISLYELTLEKGGEATIDDAVRIKCEVEDRNLPTPLYSSIEEFRKDKEEFEEKDEPEDNALNELELKSETLC